MSSHLIRPETSHASQNSCGELETATNREQLLNDKRCIHWKSISAWFRGRETAYFSSNGQKVTRLIPATAVIGSFGATELSWITSLLTLLPKCARTHINYQVRLRHPELVNIRPLPHLCSHSNNHAAAASLETIKHGLMCKVSCVTKQPNFAGLSPGPIGGNQPPLANKQ